MPAIKSDQQLWDDFRKGEKYALAHIYYQYVDQLFRYAKKFCSDDELIKDCIQDLFFDLIRTRKNLGTTDHIFFYLTKALRGRLFRSIQVSKRISYSDGKYEDFPDPFIVYSIEAEWIDKEIVSEKEEIIRKALADLSPKLREIIYYRFTCGFSYEQICEIMAIKYDSARKMVFRAMNSLRKFLIDADFLLKTTLVALIVNFF